MTVSGRSSHTVTLDNRGWYIETIWRAAVGIAVQQLSVQEIHELDEDCWFSGHAPTVREIVDHTRRIVDADLTLPIVLASDGQVLDGMHRIAKAVLTGKASVPAQRLITDPDPWTAPRRVAGAVPESADGSGVADPRQPRPTPARISGGHRRAAVTLRICS